MAKIHRIVYTETGGRRPVEVTASGGRRNAVKLAVKLARQYGDRATVFERDTKDQSEDRLVVCYKQERSRVVACTAMGPWKKHGGLTHLFPKKRRR